LEGNINKLEDQFQNKEGELLKLQSNTTANELERALLFDEQTQLEERCKELEEQYNTLKEEKEKEINTYLSSIEQSNE